LCQPVGQVVLKYAFQFAKISKPPGHAEDDLFALGLLLAAAELLGTKPSSRKTGRLNEEFTEPHAQRSGDALEVSDARIPGRAGLDVPEGDPRQTSLPCHLLLGEAIAGPKPSDVRSEWRLLSHSHVLCAPG
jgi:hypothetical protein